MSCNILWKHVRRFVNGSYAFVWFVYDKYVILIRFVNNHECFVDFFTTEFDSLFDSNYCKCNG